MLFTLNKSPFHTGSLKSCLSFANADTPILLYEDAVYAAVTGTELEATVKDALQKRKLYALGPDLKARGLENVLDGVAVVDYAGFVELVEQHNVCPWI